MVVAVLVKLQHWWLQCVAVAVGAVEVLVVLVS